MNAPVEPKMSFHDGSCFRCKDATGPLYRFTEFGKAICAGCYPDFFRRRVCATMRRSEMIRKNDLIAVALSGGKDSAALLHTLWTERWRINLRVIGLHVDMGLGEYSDHGRAVVEELTGQLGVPLVVERVADHGVQIQPAGNFEMCSVCGAVRRALLDRVGLRERVDAVATGHTLDDWLQQMLKRLLTGRLDAPKPVLPGDEFHPPKIKPLCLTPDQASEAYVQCLNLPIVSEKCPQFDPQSHRLKQVFELLEKLAPSGKQQLVNSLRKAMKAAPPGGPDRPCPECGQPTGTDVCPLCRLRRAMQDRERNARAARADEAKFRAALGKVADVEPAEEDRIE